MINSRVELLFKNLPDKHPRHLQRDYAHILNRLMQIWGTSEFDPYLHDLTIDKRGGRQGFSRAVIAELMFLGELHDIFAREGYKLPELSGSWKSIPVPNPSPLGFHQAIERGQLDVIEIFLNAGIKADYRFEGEQTALMVAAISGQWEAVHCLIEGGAGVNLRDGGQYSALHWAAFYRRSEIVAQLLDAGADINAAQNSGDTPLSLAVTRGHLEVARLLLERQADPNIASRHGSPITIATGKKNQEMVTLLSQFGALYPASGTHDS
jgi:ankyrin repeat protein